MSDWVEDETMKIEDEFKVDLASRKDEQGLETNQERNAFFKFMTTYKPTDEAANLDFRVGWGLFNQLKTQPKKETVTQKKEIAAQTMDEGKGETKKRDFLTPNDLKGGWDEIDNI